MRPRIERSAEVWLSDLRQRVLDELRPQRLLPNVTAGVIVGIIVVIVSVSLASLIFQGALAEHLADGIGLVLFSGVLATGLIALFSSYPGMVAYPQERVAPILALMATAIVSQMTGKASSQEIFLTVVAAVAVATLVNGFFLGALGVFELGNLIRFIPYPVIGGFLAGTGWLLVKGSIGVMTGMHLHASDALLLFQPDIWPKWLLGVAFGLVLVFVTHRSSHFLVMPALLLGSIAAFYGVLALARIPLETVRGSGWLLGPFPEGGPWRPLSLEALRSADWSVISTQWGNIATILVIAVVSVLLNSGALELVTKSDIDLNREMRAAGAANLLIGLSGGTVGFHSLSISRLVHSMGPQSRLVGLIGAGLCAATLAVGTSTLVFLPRATLGGILFFLGMHFLIDWVYEAYHRLTRADYAIVIMILFIVATLGYLQGVGVGIVACVILFLVNYSRVNVVKLAMTGRDRHSNVDRPSRHARILQRRGRQLHIFRLQGFIFFGTANGLLDRAREIVASPDEDLRFMLFEFSDVTGIDSSSILSFVKIRQLAEKHGFTFIFVNLSVALIRLLAKEEFELVHDAVYRRFEDLDHGLEWCENEILASEEIGSNQYDEISLQDQLNEEFGKTIEVERFLEYCDRLEVARGELLMRQGEDSDALYLIDVGQVTAELQIGPGEATRLRTMCSGTIVGEMGLILDRPRSASVVAERPSTVYRLTAESLQAMLDENPALAASFFHYLTHLMAERLANTNETLQALLE